jgi:hypothetical protein
VCVLHAEEVVVGMLRKEFFQSPPDSVRLGLQRAQHVHDALYPLPVLLLLDLKMPR